MERSLSFRTFVSDLNYYTLVVIDFDPCTVTAKSGFWAIGDEAVKGSHLRSRIASTVRSVDPVSDT